MSRVTHDLPLMSSPTVFEVSDTNGADFLALEIRIDDLYLLDTKNLAKHPSGATVTMHVQRKDEDFFRGIDQEFKGRVVGDPFSQVFYIPLGDPCQVPLTVKICLLENHVDGQLRRPMAAATLVSHWLVVGKELIAETFISPEVTSQ